MVRHASKPQPKGSQHWIQELVNTNQGILTEALRSPLGLAPTQGINWRSPLAVDDYAEYQDGDFLTRLGIQLPGTPLNTFWPRLGPCWDALGITVLNQPILVEAKSHICELNSPPCGAGIKTSIDLINVSLQKTQIAMKATASAADWSKTFYQYANRLAHLHLLRGLNDFDAYLVFLHCINDQDMKGPANKEEWLGAINLLQCQLGLSKNPYENYIIDLFYDVNANQFV